MFPPFGKPLNMSIFISFVDVLVALIITQPNACVSALQHSPSTATSSSSSGFDVEMANSACVFSPSTNDDNVGVPISWIHLHRRHQNSNRPSTTTVSHKLHQSAATKNPSSFSKTPRACWLRVSSRDQVTSSLGLVQNSFGPLDSCDNSLTKGMDVESMDHESSFNSVQQDSRLSGGSKRIPQLWGHNLLPTLYNNTLRLSPRPISTHPRAGGPKGTIYSGDCTMRCWWKWASWGHDISYIIAFFYFSFCPGKLAKKM